MQHRSRFVLLACALLATFPAAAGLTARLEPERRYYYEGETVVARLVLENAGERRESNPAKKSAAAGLEIRAQGEPSLVAGSARDSPEGAPSREIAAGASYEATIDLGAVEPLGRAGRYELRWTSGDLASAWAEVVVLERFDPSLQYVAHLDTDLGSIAVRLSPRASPVAVRAFVDLARSGYYDGAPFHETQPGSYVGAGDPRFVAAGDRAFFFPAEQSEVAVVLGTVVLKPVSPAPPANGPAFLISLRTEPGWIGQVTILGQVVDGLDIVDRISRIAVTEGGVADPAARVRIRRVRIETEPALERFGAR